MLLPNDPLFQNIATQWHPYYFPATYDGDNDSPFSHSNLPNYLIQVPKRDFLFKIAVCRQ